MMAATRLQPAHPFSTKEQGLGTDSLHPNDFVHVRKQQFLVQVGILSGGYLRVRVGGPGESRRGSVTACEGNLQVEGQSLSEDVEALGLLVERGSYVHRSVFYNALKRCVANKDLALGSRVHALAVRSGYESNAFLANHFIGMYSSHGRLEDAKRVFSKVPAPDRYMWGSIILGHARRGQPQEAVRLYRQMRDSSSVEPDNHIFLAVLMACASSQDLASGKVVHADIVKSAGKADMFVCNCLVDMYAKCGSLEDARKVFDGLPSRNVVTWTAMISGYSQHGLGKEALDLYGRMKREAAAVPANAVTFVCLLQACAGVRDLHQGRQIHAQIREQRLEGDAVVGTSLVDMYAKCGSLDNACRVFDSLQARDVVTWNALIAGYAQQGLCQEALALYGRMQQERGVAPNAVTFAGLLQACGTAKALYQGQQLHAQVREKGLGRDVVVGTGLVDMYAKCGSLEDARRVFDHLPFKTAGTWTAMIAGYARNGFGGEALTLYGCMRQESSSTSVSAVIFVCLLQACGSMAALEKGKEIHDDISRLGGGLEATELSVANALVDMYGKCGSMADAQQVFDALPHRKRDGVTWNALLAGYARQGESDLVLRLFQRMEEEGVSPDGIAFASVLNVCSHVGLVDQGWAYFQAMSRDYNISPTIEHYTCMVDLLGRAGQVEQAMQLVRTMPFPPDGVVWRCVLGACRKWKLVELGREAFDSATRLDKHDPAAYTLMSNIYAAAEMWDEAKAIQAMRVRTRAWKKPGQSWWTDIAGTLHTFVVGMGVADHPEWQVIDAKLRHLFLEMKKAGYVPHLGSVLHNIPDHEKEAALCGHSEKLAIAYALHKTPPGTTIRIVKNLRVCEDCHTATALISLIEQRTIICRDASRFHTFKEGTCSCGDYW